MWLVVAQAVCWSAGGVPCSIRSPTCSANAGRAWLLARLFRMQSRSHCRPTPAPILGYRVDLEVIKRSGTAKQAWLVERIEPVGLREGVPRDSKNGCIVMTMDVKLLRDPIAVASPVLAWPPDFVCPASSLPRPPAA